MCDRVPVKVQSKHRTCRSRNMGVTPASSVRTGQLCGVVLRPAGVEGKLAFRRIFLHLIGADYEFVHDTTTQRERKDALVGYIRPSSATSSDREGEGVC